MKNIFTDKEKENRAFFDNLLKKTKTKKKSRKIYQNRVEKDKQNTYNNALNNNKNNTCYNLEIPLLKDNNDFISNINESHLVHFRKSKKLINPKKYSNTHFEEEI